MLSTIILFFKYQLLVFAFLQPFLKCEEPLHYFSVNIPTMLQLTLLFNGLKQTLIFKKNCYSKQQKCCRKCVHWKHFTQA